MKVSPYLIFNGNCMEAIKLYEKAFDTKAVGVCQYKDTPPMEGTPPMPEEMAELVMHGVLPIGHETIYICDTTPDMNSTFSNGVSVCVELNSAEEVKSAFEVLKEDGKVFCDAQETFWNKCYCEFEDKFGIKWAIMIEECSCDDKCASGYNPDCTCYSSECHCREIPS